MVFDDSLFDVIIARDIATIPAIYVTMDDNLATALSLIDAHEIERLPVVRNGEEVQRVVGILSQRDIMSAYNQALEARGLKERLAIP